MGSSRRPSVCFVIQKLAGLSGGAERVLIDVASGLAARDMDVEIVCYERNGGVPYYPLQGVSHRNLFPRQVSISTERPPSFGLEARVRGTPNMFPLGHLKWHVTYGAFIRALRRHLGETRPDVVIGFMPTGIMVAAMAAHELGIPCIGSTHNVPEEDFGASQRWDPNPVYRKRRMESLDLVDRLLVLQPEFRDWFAPHLGPKIDVMPNPIAPLEGPVVPPERREPIVISVGRLTRVKRHAELLRAWGIAAKQFPDWQLHIYGVGPEKEALAKQINSLGLQDKARLCGVTPNIFDRYQEASLMCHPAEFEGFGLSVAEALSCGLPVIASQECSGVRNLIEDGRNGVLVKDGPGFVDNLGKTLSELIKAPGRRARLGRSGPGSLERFAPEIVYDKWETLVRGLRRKK